MEDEPPDVPLGPISVRPRKRGRPPGARNKPKFRAPMMPAYSDKLVDPMKIVDDQLKILAWTQEVFRTEQEARVADRGKLDSADVRGLNELSNSIARSVDALRRVHVIAEEVAAKMSPEQLLDAALRKVEGQDVKYINYALRRLKAYRDTLVPRETVPPDTALDAIASLEDE